MPWYMYLCCGIGIFFGVFFLFALIKSRGANSNYTEFSIDDVPVETLWRNHK